MKNKTWVLETPISEETARQLRAGDIVYLSGVIYTARDAAHRKLVEHLKSNGTLPFDLLNQAIYYVGPTPTPPDAVIGSAGPTTSYRMDKYTEALLEQGLRVMIGKGQRSPAVKAAMKKYGAVYLAAPGGCGALLGECVGENTTIAYEELGMEAVRRLVVNNTELVVAGDTYGGDLYVSGPTNHRRRVKRQRKEK